MIPLDSIRVDSPNWDFARGRRTQAINSYMRAPESLPTLFKHWRTMTTAKMRESDFDEDRERRNKLIFIKSFVGRPMNTYTSARCVGCRLYTNSTTERNKWKRNKWIIFFRSLVRIHSRQSFAIRPWSASGIFIVSLRTFAIIFLCRVHNLYPTSHIASATSHHALDIRGSSSKENGTKRERTEQKHAAI